MENYILQTLTKNSGLTTFIPDKKKIQGKKIITWARGTFHEHENCILPIYENSSLLYA